MKFSITALLSCAALASAAGPVLSGTCAGNKYSADEVSAAADASCKLLKAKKTVGNQNYPHEYKNYEKIQFQVAGPWYEFPIVRGGTFDGNRGPGPDRVIINGDCDEAGLITHTGAGGNGFNACDVSKGNSGSGSSSSSSSSDASSTSSRRGGSRTTSTSSDTATTTAAARGSSSSSTSSAKPTSTNAADAIRGSVAGVAAAGLVAAALL